MYAPRENQFSRVSEITILKRDYYLKNVIFCMERSLEIILISN